MVPEAQEKPPWRAPPALAWVQPAPGLRCGRFAARRTASQAAPASAAPGPPAVEAEQRVAAQRPQREGPSLSVVPAGWHGPLPLAQVVAPAQPAREASTLELELELEPDLAPGPPLARLQARQRVPGPPCLSAPGGAHGESLRARARPAAGRQQHSRQRPPARHCAVAPFPERDGCGAAPAERGSVLAAASLQGHGRTADDALERRARRWPGSRAWPHPQAMRRRRQRNQDASDGSASGNVHAGWPDQSPSQAPAWCSGPHPGATSPRAQRSVRPPAGGPRVRGLPASPPPFDRQPGKAPPSPARTAGAAHAGRWHSVRAPHESPATARPVRPTR